MDARQATRVNALLVRNDGAWGFRPLPDHLAAEAFKSVARLRDDVPLPALLSALDRGRSVVMVMQAADGDLFGAVAVGRALRVGGVKTFCVDVDVRSPVNPGSTFANIIESLARTPAPDRTVCDRISIVANGPFPCPAGYERHERPNGACTMTMEFQWS